MKIADLQLGGRYLLRGFGLIRRPGLRRFVVIPLLINLLLFGSAIWLGANQFSVLLDWGLPAKVAWLEYLLWPLFALAMLLISFYTFTLVANLIGAPFNDRLAERVAVRVGMREERDNPSSLVGDVGQAVGGELRKWLYFAPLLLGTALLWLLGFLLPPLALVVPLLWFALGAWMLGFEYIDYPLSNVDLKFSDKKRWLRKRRAKVLGFGAATLGLTMIPVVNFFVMPAAVAGATLLWADADNEEPGDA